MADDVTTSDDQSLLQQGIDRLKSMGAQFTAAYQTLLADYDVAQTDADLLAEWQSIKARAEQVKSVIEWVNRQVDSAVSWLGNVFGLSGMGSMGVIPLIPVAYVTAAVAALVYVIGQISEFHQKAELVRAQLAPGSILAPNQTVIGETSDLLKWAIIGAVIYFAGPPILKRLGVRI